MSDRETGSDAMTADQVIARMVSLHNELGNFQVFVNMNQEVIGNEIAREARNAIEFIGDMIEVEVRRLQTYKKTIVIDAAVVSSLKAAGFTPDVQVTQEPKPEQPHDEQP